MKHLPEFDSRDFVKSIQNKVQLEVESTGLFPFENIEKKEENNFAKKAAYTGGAILFGIPGLIAVKGFDVGKKMWNHGEEKQKALEWVNSISFDFDPDPYLRNAFHGKDKVIDSVKQSFITDLIEPLQEQINEIRSKRDEKDKELSDAQKKRDDLENKKNVIIAQLEEFNSTKNAIL